ncbi:hypothetical protein HK101_001926, partial [Irineochytrium annulatum]
MAILDPSLSVRWCNDSLSRAAGRTPGSNAMAHLPFLSLVDSEEGEFEALGTVLAAGRSVRRDLWLKKIKEPDDGNANGNGMKAEGEVETEEEDEDEAGCWFGCDFTPVIGNNGALETVLVVMYDISHQRQMKEIEEASKMQTDFVTLISHELRTPLNGIMGATSTILHELSHLKPDEVYEGVDLLEIRDTTAIVMSSSQLLLNLVNNVLDIQRIDAGKMDANTATMPVSACVVRALRACQYIAQQRDVRVLSILAGHLLHIDADGTSGRPGHPAAAADVVQGEAPHHGWVRVGEKGCWLKRVHDDSQEVALVLEPLGDGPDCDWRSMPDLVESDAAKLSQCCINLIGNAIKFSPMGSVVKLEVKPLVVTGPNGNPTVSILFSVCDQGRGISPADSSRLFQAFSQINPSSPEASRGSGLGLNICRRLLGFLGGDIWVGDGGNGVGNRPATRMEPLEIRRDKRAMEAAGVGSRIPESEGAVFRGARFHFCVPVVDATVDKSGNVGNGPLVVSAARRGVSDQRRRRRRREGTRSSEVEVPDVAAEH